MEQENTSADQPQDFETAMKQLEALVDRMESGELPLEESLALYEQGVKLAKICQQRLNYVEDQIKVLQGNALETLESEGNS